VNVAQLKALDTIVAGIDFPIRSSSTQPYTTSVTGIDALAVGSNANANGDSSTAVGENAFANGIQASAFGADAEATARSSLASGFEAKAKGGESVALGVKSSAESLGATAVGPTANARGEDSVALGRRSRADGDGALALGGFSKAVGANASAVGFKAEATNKNATAIGVNAKALGERSVALGEGAQATTLTGTAIGSRTLASAVQSTAVGVGSKATKQWATAMGFSSEANGVSSVALGDRSVVDGKESIAIGKGNTVSGANSIAIGTENNVTGNNSGAFGDPNTITGSGSYVMGNDNTVGNDNTFVLGNEVETTQDNSIVLGNLSTDRAATTETGGTINGTPYIYAGSAPVGVMSVGSVGNERQIINVAAGAVNATSTDAVNGSQLHATNEAVESNTTNINKGFALKAADGQTVMKQLGEQVEVVGSNDNIDTRVRNGKIEVKLNNDLDLGSNGSISTGNIFGGTQVNRLGMVTGGLAMGGVTTVSGLGVTVTGTNPLSNATLTSDGLSMFNGPSITKSNGINAGNKRVINVDNGIQAKDAVNVSQLNSASAASRTEVVAGTNVADVVKSMGDNGQDVYTVNAKGSKTSAGSAAVTVSAATDTTNLTDYAVDLSQDTKDSLIKADNSVQYDNLAKTSVTLGGMGSTSPVTLTNVAAGDISEASTDAVNGSQLFETNTKVNQGFGLKAADGQTVMKQLGEQVEVVGSNDNIDTRVRNGKIEVKLNNDLDLGSNGSVKMGSSFPFGLGRTTTLDRSGLTTGNSLLNTTVDGLGVRTGNALVNTRVSSLGVTVSNPFSTTVLSSSGLNIDGGPSMTTTGINAGNKKVTNVKAGVLDKDAVNVSQLNSSTAAAKTEVVAGTNVADVVKSTGDNGQDVYTVNANGTKTSAGSSAVTVSAATDTTNLTDYAVDLSQDTKDSLIKADNSVQYDNLAKTSVTLGGMGSTSPVTLTNVAAGDISEASTDAVNGSQLFETNTKVNQGFGLKAADGQTVMKQLGEQVEVVGSNDNIDTRVRNGKIEVKLNNDLDLGSNGSVKMGSSFPFGLGRTTTLDRSGLTTGNSLLNTTVDGLGVRTGNALVNTRVSSLGVTVSNPFSTTVLSSSGLNIDGGPSMTTTGINAGNKKVTNVKAGVLDKDAVNVSQLNSSTAAAKTEVVAGTNVADVVKSTGDNGQDVYTVNAKGSKTSAGSAAVEVSSTTDTNNMTDYAVDLSESSKASLVKADSAIQTVITQIDGQNVKTLDKTDNTANFLTGDNIVLTAEDNGIKVSTKDKVAFTEVTTGNTLVNTGGVSFLEGSTVRLSSTGLDNGGNQIKGVAAGVLDSDAVNFGQLQATTTTVDKGLNFGGDSGTDVNRKLGQKLTVKGGDTIDADPATKNISVTANGADTLTVRLAKDINLGDTGSVTTGNTQVNNAGITLYNGDNNQVALTNNGLNNGNNKITNVADGLLSTTSQDAVNGRQLFETNENIAKGIKIGDGNSANDQQFALGDTINVTGDSNLTTVASATGVQVRLNNQLDLGDDGRMQIGDSIMNSTGFTFVDNGLGRTVLLSSRGLDNGGNPIRNVGKGTLDTDAVNVGQLNEVAVALDQGWGITAQGDVATMVRQGSTVDMNSKDGNIKVSRTLVNNAATGASAAAIPAGPNDISFDLNPDISVVSVTAGETTINDNGLTILGGPSVTKSGIDAADNKITNVQNGAVTEDSQDAINGGQLYAQGSGISSIIGGNTVYNPLDGTFTNSNIGGTGQGNIDGAIASIRQGTIAINENVQNNTTAITTNTTNIATNTTNISTNTTNIAANKDRLDAGLNFGADSGANINKPVGDASVLSFTGGNNITTTAEGSSIKFDLNGNINVDSVTAGTTVINSNGISMQDGPSMTAQGLYAGNQRMTGVADGVEARDAVNFGQLDAVSRRLGDNMNQLGYKIGEVEEDANAGISAAMAMSSLPQAYISGKSMIGGGVGTYNGESAVAIGFSKLSNDGRWVMKLSGTADTQGNAGASIGAGFHFD
jgi:autotransporter adhesin